MQVLQKVVKDTIDKVSLTYLKDVMQHTVYIILDKEKDTISSIKDTLSKHSVTYIEAETLAHVSTLLKTKESEELIYLITDYDTALKDNVLCNLHLVVDSTKSIAAIEEESLDKTYFLYVLSNKKYSRETYFKSLDTKTYLDFSEYSKFLYESLGIIQEAKISKENLLTLN